MKKVILDTNFLLIPGQFKVDIFSEIKRIIDDTYELCIIDGTLTELNDITDKAKKGSDKRAAKLALSLIDSKKFKQIKSDKIVDDAILQQKNVIVATQDAELVKKLHKKGVKTIGLRKKSYLILKP